MSLRSRSRLMRSQQAGERVHSNGLSHRRHHFRFVPPKKGFAAACFIHEATCCSSSSFTDFNSTPRVDLPIPTGVTGGSGLISVPLMNISFKWPTKAPDEKHQPPPTP